MASKVLCFPKAGQAALVLSQAPRAALYKTQAVCNWFHKEFLFSLLIKVLQRESEVFVFHDSQERLTVYAGRFPNKEKKKKGILLGQILALKLLYFLPCR